MDGYAKAQNVNTSMALSEMVRLKAEELSALRSQLDRAEAEIEALRKDRSLLAEVVQAPFPLHDYCSEEAWTRACEIVAALKEADRDGDR